jgi:2-polyprenyl-6-methoxyphenol hydroxylase-like FAD-dependent oxidoreductase
MRRTLDEASVLVVGAGPVGLTLAMDLAWRGIDVLIIELRDHKEPPRIRSNHVSARSMEIFRRLGVAGKVREAGLPADYPNDVSFRTTMTGIELSRIPIPSRATRVTTKHGLDTWWPTPEPPHRVNQIYLEPVLRAHVVAMPRVRMFHRCQLEDYVQSESGVVATVRDLSTGNVFSVASAYLVGCDGGRSIVRKKLGARLNGTSIIQRVQSTYIRALELLGLLAGPPAWICHSLNPRRSGTVFAIDGREKWLVHNHLYDDEPIDRDWAIRMILGVGTDFRYEVISHEDWVGRRLVADRFRDRRVFVCGDAAHLWIPYAGYGMNAGIADATNLSWLLAGVLKGWASPTILDAYEAERRPITEQVSHFAMNLALSNIALRKEIPPEIEMPGAAGDAVRARVGKQFYDLNVQQYCAGGLNFGYFYDASPIIAYDGEAQPAYTMAEFTSSSVPGCRAPHIWLDGGRSLYDALGPEYTLLRLDPMVRISSVVEAAARRRVPLTILDIAMADAPATYGYKLVLVRPDQHIGWRGDKEPIDCVDLIDHLRGAVRERLRH